MRQEVEIFKIFTNPKMENKNSDWIGQIILLIFNFDLWTFLKMICYITSQVVVYNVCMHTHARTCTWTCTHTHHPTALLLKISKYDVLTIRSLSDVLEMENSLKRTLPPKEAPLVYAGTQIQYP